LAATMPDNPGRVQAVQRLVRRRHRRRVAARASIGVACTAGGGVVMVTTTSKRSENLPMAAGATDPPAPATTSPATDSSTPADSGANLDGTQTGPDTTGGEFKGSGTITAVDGSTISVDVIESPLDVASFTATLAADTLYDDRGVPTAIPPALAVGDVIGF